MTRPISGRGFGGNIWRSGVGRRNIFYVPGVIVSHGFVYLYEGVSRRDTGRKR